MMRPLFMAAALVFTASPLMAEPIKDRSGKVTGTIRQTSPDSFMIRDRSGKATARITCPGNTCFVRDPRTGKTLGTTTRKDGR